MGSRWNQATFLHCSSASILRARWQSSTRPPPRWGCSHPIPSYPKGSWHLPFGEQQPPGLQGHSMHTYLPGDFPLRLLACTELPGRYLLAPPWIQPNGSPPLVLLHLSWKQNCPGSPAGLSELDRWGVLHSYRDRFTPSALFLHRVCAMPGKLLVFPTPGSMALSPNGGIHEQAGGASNHCFEIGLACWEWWSVCRTWALWSGQSTWHGEKPGLGSWCGEYFGTYGRVVEL